MDGHLFRRNYDQKSVDYWVKVSERFKCFEWVKAGVLRDNEDKLPCMIYRGKWKNIMVTMEIASKKQWNELIETYFFGKREFYEWDMYLPRNARWKEKEIHRWIKEYKEED